LVFLEAEIIDEEEMNRILAATSLLIYAFFVPLFSSAQENGSISAEAFGALPEILSVQISPDGNKILILKTINGEIVIVTKMLGEDTIEENIIPYDDGIFNWAIWVSNDRILASVKFEGHEDRAKNLRVSSQRRLLSMTWDGNDMINPNRFRKRGRTNRAFSRRQPQLQDRLIDILKDDPDHVLVQMDIDRLGEPAVYKLNIKTKKRTRVLKGRRSVDYWMTDQNHDVRYGEGFVELKGSRGVRHVAYYRKSINEKWITLFDYDETDEPRPFYFEGFTKDDAVVYITANDEMGNRALYTYNVDSHKKINKIAGDSDYDIVDVAIGEDYELEYYSYYRDKPDIVRLKNHGKILDQITDEVFNGLSVSISSHSKDKNKVILNVSSPKMPATFYYLDISTKELNKIGQSYGGIDQSKLSMKEPITYIARDGVEIPGYLSRPASGALNSPTIILPHGGPMARDGWSFDYWTQYLTTRGYAVLQMNYRGSTGYGEEFRRMGYHEWGRKMLYDINDGAKWMIEQGYSDREKICIMGGSYGGYAALQSIVLGEVEYKCSVAFAPVSHIQGLMQSLKNAPGFKSYKSYVESEEWSLNEASPSFNIDKINIPVLLFHGSKDMSVPIVQSRGFRDRMESADKELKYIEFEDGDHFLSDEKHRMKFLMETGKFLSEHLK
tara:strand:- start:314365 stop:316368 length:2004 start_codon:yes stop_codon:yes gene_type:complete